MKDEVKNLVHLRTAADTDHNFIISTWLRGLYYGNSFFRQIEKDEFMEFYGRVVNNIIFKPTVELRIACLKDDHDTILGYAAIESMDPYVIAHWTFVKPEWRKLGIASDLVPETVNTITHITDSMCRLKLKNEAKSDRYLSNYELKLKNRKLAFKPFLV